MPESGRLRISRNWPDSWFWRRLGCLKVCRYTCWGVLCLAIRGRKAQKGRRATQGWLTPSIQSLGMNPHGLIVCLKVPPGNTAAWETEDACNYCISTSWVRLDQGVNHREKIFTSKLIWAAAHRMTLAGKQWCALRDHVAEGFWVRPFCLLWQWKHKGWDTKGLSWMHISFHCDLSIHVVYLYNHCAHSPALEGHLHEDRAILSKTVRLFRPYFGAFFCFTNLLVSMSVFHCLDYSVFISGVSIRWY